MFRALLFTLALVCAAPVTQAQVYTPYDFASGFADLRFVTQLSDGTVLVGDLGAGNVWAYPASGGNSNATLFASGLAGPEGITQLSDGTVLVSESNAGRVSAYPASGGNANRTDFATGLSQPLGLTQLADGTVLVVELGGGRVSAFPSSGGNANRADFATGLTGPISATQLADGTVLVSERNIGRVSAYPSSGGNANRTDFATGLTSPHGVEQLADGNVLIAEYNGQVVSSYPASGGNANRSVFASGGFLTHLTQLRDGTVLVAELASRRVLSFGLTRRTFTDGMTITQGVTQLADGRVLVADFGFGAIREFATDGTETRFATVSGSPTDIIELPNGIVLVSLLGTDVVAAFDPTGTRLAPDYATGLSNPTGFGVLADGRVVVAEQSGGRVTVVADAAGGRVTPSTFISGLSGPFDLARLDDGRMLVTERLANRVSVISDAAGVPLPSPSPLVLSLNNPTGIVQLGDGRVLVSEFNDAEATVFQTDGFGRAQFAGALTRATFVTQLADGRVIVAQEFISSPGTGQVTEFGGLAGPPVSVQLAGEQDYRMLALPTGGTYDDLLGPLWTQGFTGSDNASGGCSVYTFTEATGDFDTAYACLSDQSATFARGAGVYAFVYEDDDLTASGVQGGFPKTLTASGAPGTAPFSAFPLTYTDGATTPAVEEGWNLLGNPLATGFDWDLATRGGGLSGAIYVYDPNYLGGDYRTWSAGIGGDLPDGIVPPFQGFFVKAAAASPTLEIPTSAVAASSPGVYGKSASGETALRFELSLNGSPVSTSFVAVAPEAALGEDTRDAYRLTPSAWPRTVLSTRGVNEATPLAINAIPHDASGEMDIPLTIAAEGHASGVLDLRLAWSGGLPEGWSAVLIDREQNTATPLAAGGTYAFTLDVSETAKRSTALGLDLMGFAPEASKNGGSADSGDRFALRLTPASVTSTNASPEAAFGLGAPAPNPARGAVRVPYRLSASGEAAVAVYDALGREVAVLASGAHAAGSHEATLDAALLAPGVYVVRLSTPEAASVRRITVVR